MKTYYLFINGILGGNADGWQEHAKAYINANGLGVGDCESYWTGVAGLWGRWQVAKRVAAKLRGAYRSGQFDRIVVVTHSFGAVIFLLALSYLLDEPLDFGPIVDVWWGLGAACPEDCRKNGLPEAIRAGQLEHAIMGVSTEDDVLRYLAPLQRWLGFGQMGYRGPTHVPDDVATDINVLPHHTYDHESWVYSQFQTTMDEITAPAAITPAVP